MFLPRVVFGADLNEIYKQGSLISYASTSLSPGYEISEI